MRTLPLSALLFLMTNVPALAQITATTTEEAAKLFGHREAIASATLSPDGNSIAFIGPSDGQASILYAMDTSKENKPHAVFKASGDPDRLFRCPWVANDRLACTIGGLQAYDNEVYSFSNIIAINADGTGTKLLSKRQGQNALYGNLYGGNIVDYLPGEDGMVLMARAYVPEAKIGSLVEKKLEGLGIDRIDTRTMAIKRIETPRADAIEYITDGNGQVRIAGFNKSTPSGYMQGTITYLFRAKEARDWRPLGTYDIQAETGFNPYVVDPAKDVVYGFNKVNGRKALVSINLAAPTIAEEVVAARSDVDVDGLIQIGKRRRVVGASYATERRESIYFDPDLKRLAASLGKALPNQPLIEFVDANLDETKLLLWAGGDTAPGTYYLFDKAAKKLQPVMPVRPELAGVTLAKVQPVSFPAADGTMIPGYLTLPPGSSGKGLPAIVMPHGGPSSRDEWGFDWLAQFYANRGYAVLQPNYRGSSGYGDSWYQENGFKSWRTAIGDVNDAGRWLAKAGVADPKKLFIVGWSYGGYAALQSAVTEPGLFKAVVAIAPVTDLEMTKDDVRNFTIRRITEDFIGSGPHVKEGSPAQNAARIAVPVQIFHAELDRNVRIGQSRFMAKQMKAAGKPVELIEYPKLEHSLVDSAVRADMLRRSAEFLAAAVR